MEQEVLDLALVALKLASQIVQYLAAFAVGIALWLVKKILNEQKAFGARLVALEAEHQTLAKDQKNLTKCVENQPSDKALADLAGDVKAVREIVERVERMVNRHEDHLLNKGGK